MTIGQQYYPLGNGGASGPLGYFDPVKMIQHGGNGTNTTGSVSFECASGVAPFTYVWAAIGSTPVTIDDSTAQSTTFTGTGTNSELDGTFNCTRTDALGNVVTSENNLFVIMFFGTIE
jgi:hypothetical protein